MEEDEFYDTDLEDQSPDEENEGEDLSVNLSRSTQEVYPQECYPLLRPIRLLG